MANKQSFVSPRENDVGDIYASIRILSIIGNLTGLREWLRKEKTIQDSEQLVRGTGFFFEVALLSLAWSVRFDSSLGLTESLAFSRADFHGDIDIEEIPNDCEKTILLKRIKSTLKSVRKCKSWNDLERVLPDIRSLIDPIREVVEEHASPGLGLSMQEAKDFVTKRHLFVFFQESERGLPKVCLLSPLLPYRRGGVFFADVFSYYVLCLEFVWKDILGATFENSKMSKIQEGLPEFKPLAEKHLSAEESWFDDPLLAKLSDLVEVPVEQREEADSDRLSPKEREGFVSWLSLDRLSNSAYHEELAPLEKSLGSASWTLPALTIAKVDKSTLEDLLSKDCISEPSYFSGKDWESKRRLLDYCFLWYPMEVLDAGLTKIFNGVPAFLSVVMGACSLRDSFGADSPIEVRVFKHPVRKFEEGFEYSYAVLIEVQGAISDHSGWLVFSDCTGEYSGYPEYECLLARKRLDKMEEEEDIRPTEVTIDLNSFRRYLQENGRVMAETARGATLMESREIIESQREIISALRGKFFEYVFYRWLAMQGSYIEVKGPGEFKDVQIDCLGIRESDIDIYECKIDLHRGIDDVVRQIRAKEEAIRCRFPHKMTHPYVAVYRKVNTLDRLGLEHRGIGVIDDFRGRIGNMNIHNSDRHDILRILDFDVARIIE